MKEKIPLQRCALTVARHGGDILGLTLIEFLRHFDMPYWSIQSWFDCCSAWYETFFESHKWNFSDILNAMCQNVKEIPSRSILSWKLEAMGREVKTKIPLLRRVLTVARHGVRRCSTPINGILCDIKKHNWVSTWFDIHYQLLYLRLFPSIQHNFMGNLGTLWTIEFQNWD